MKKLFLSVALLVAVTSCMTTKTPVGKFSQTEGKTKTYSKAKQIYILWGMFPLGRASAATPEDGNCQVVTRYNIGDFLITGLTGGIVSTYSIKVEVKKPKEEK
jgi:hypothetical protein